MKDTPFYIALKKLSSDVRELMRLSANETEESWDRMIETLRKELQDEAGSRGSNNDELMFHSLIGDIYDHLGMLIRRIKDSQAKLRRLATRDILTGLYNRHFFNESIVRDVQIAKRRHETLSVIVIDIDDFKRINDTYGHLHGDGVIMECAKILKSCVRKSDFLCRYGGDEFIIVTPEASVGANGPLFERIAESLRRWNAEFASFDYELSVSMGCAVWTEGRDMLAVIDEADRNMYAEKQKTKQRKRT